MAAISGFFLPGGFMKRDELLIKLAMELESWPDFQEGQAPPPNTPGIWGTHCGAWECFVKGNTNPILYGHWLKRRTELINCPPDSEAPNWATHKYQGPTGFWYWSSCALSLTDDAALWQSSGGSVLIAKRGRIISGHDWRTTLTEVNKSTCTAEEDAAWQEKEAKLNASKEWDGVGLPPINIECEYWYPEGQEFRHGRCIAHYRGMAVMIDSKDQGAQTASIVRLIRTERDCWIDRALEELETKNAIHSSRLAMGILYDAGLARLSGDA